ncbi:MerR family transcriptional regulator [Propionicicella superfundia]|uniref:MerR family transcriptional regulator n=1 Tax=Propionicicella superfundia TaxID=348582 RepID=UPI0004251D0E|nr:MerR family transcriptional regulator [Propionicicella superfundia]
MDRNDDSLLRIGAFSTMSRISVRMLRHYQEHGVLIPARVDPFSGYRYYRAEQLADANLAVQLRDAGFSVEKIAQLLESTDPAMVEAAIDARRRELSRQREDLHAQLIALDRVSTTLKGRPEMTEVTVTTLPEMEIAALRKIIPGYGDEGILWQEIMPLLQQSGASFPAGGISGATFHDPEHREADVDVEVWIQVAGPFTPVAPLDRRHQPSQEIVTATLTGDYSQMPSITGAIGVYIAGHRLRTGPMFNIYRVSPAQNPDPSSWITDVCFPILGR